MRNGLYFKLASTNIRKNGRFYFPYIIACAITAMMFCIVLTLMRDPALEEIDGGGNVMVCLGLGAFITVVFSVLILFYTSSVLIKNRKKEFGLYNILGMEKSHIGKLLLIETLYSAAVSLLIGIIGSIVFSKLIQMLLMRILGAGVKFGFRIDLVAIGATVLVYTAIFFLVYFNTLRIVRKARPVDLLQGSAEGEKEPKSNWLTALLGIICLGAGYGISLASDSPVYGITMFFIAVLFVIAGTYLVFTAFSIVLLKALKKSKKFYYTTSHFPTVSGMLYRMKRNASGLASICILSTMVLVTISTTVCLYTGADSIIDARYPYDLTLSFRGTMSDSHFDYAQEKLGEIVDEHGLTASNMKAYKSLEFAVIRNGDSLAIEGYNMQNSVDTKNVVIVWLTDPTGYENITGERVSLEKGKLLCCSDEKAFGESITLGKTEYKIENTAKLPIRSSYNESQGYKTFYFVTDSVDTLTEIESIEQEVYSGNSSKINEIIRLDLDGTDRQKIDLAHSLSSDAFTPEGEETVSVYIASKQAERNEDFMTFFGAFFFLGIFLGLLFIFAAVLIIYYKQVSEGYDDRGRFYIMQKVGMTEKEVKSTIHSQILTVFFLPLVTAGIHVAFAFPIISYIMRAFGMYNTSLFAICSAVTFVVFALLYTAVYSLTAKTYYGIVSASSGYKE